MSGYRLGKKSNRKRANQPCACGCGKRAKDCCDPQKKSQKVIPFSALSPETRNLFVKAREAYNEQYQQYGHIGLPVSMVRDGHRYVSVGNTLIPFDPQKTYLDFLYEHLQTVLGRSWIHTELKKTSDEQHQIIKLYMSVGEIQRRHARKEGRLYVLDGSGPLQAWFHLAYDLHVLTHHAALNAKVLERLKHRNEYQGARYEICIAAAMIRAGFDVSHEDQQDTSSKHFEFVAMFRKTKERVAVEVKSRHRAGVQDFAGSKTENPQPKLGIGHLLHDALKKPSVYPKIIFIDLNAPPLEGDLPNANWSKEFRNTLLNKEKENQGTLPASAVVLTNSPHHYADDVTPNPLSSYMIKEIPDSTYTTLNREILNAIAQSLSQYGNIPNFFEDQARARRAQ